MASRKFYRVTRDLHLYVGLFLSPFVILFCLSVFSLNHTWLPWGGVDDDAPETRSMTVQVPAEEENLSFARAVQEQIAVPGEIDFIRRNEEEQTVSFPVTAPGYRTMVEVELATGLTRIAEQRTGVWDAMNYLHKMPGPHNVSVRGNWFGTRLWKYSADAFVYLLLFLSVSGVYMWMTIRSERQAGLLFLGGGILSFLIILLAIVA